MSTRTTAAPPGDPRETTTPDLLAWARVALDAARPRARIPTLGAVPGLDYYHRPPAVPWQSHHAPTVVCRYVPEPHPRRSSYRWRTLTAVSIGVLLGAGGGWAVVIVAELGMWAR